ncbi:helicase associated domain-containing protein, partial [Streptomyces sp. NPDC060333]|uniref:helicase associated domain-containing protein n=1 Tax=Streptomyces sp. NPDC060333 TaxID=3347098 RepID=UPI00364EB879
ARYRQGYAARPMSDSEADRPCEANERTPGDIAPGVRGHSEDVEQREHLADLGVTAAPKPAEPARPHRSAGNAFDRGVEALAQYAAREDRVVVPRAHTEVLPDGTAVRVGVWLSNTRSRRDGLSVEQRERLAVLGVDWA